MRASSPGFILTLELLLILCIFGVVVIFAISIAQRYVVNNVSNPFGRNVFVYDSTPPSGSSLLVGRAVGFTQYEAPLILYRIADPDPRLAALLGVRPSNFTTRTSVFYSNAGCSGATWMLDPTNVTSGTVGEVSDLYGTQGTAFAIGLSGGSQNVLFRSASGAAPATTPASRWVSERYANNCEPVADDPVLRAALIPGTVIANMSTIFTPPYWSPATTIGTLPTPSPNPTEDDPWL